MVKDSVESTLEQEEEGGFELYDGFYFRTIAEDMDMFEAERTVMEFGDDLRRYSERNGLRLTWKTVYEDAAIKGLNFRASPEVFSLENIKSFLTDQSMKGYVEYEGKGAGDIKLGARLSMNWEDSRKVYEFEELLDRYTDGV